MFLAVAENSSFTAAGQQLHVAQSAISRKIKLLEEELGENLFRRSAKRVYLTEAGEIMLRHTRKVFQDLRTAQLEVSELSRMHRGLLRIGANMTACLYLLPPALEKFRALHPNIDTQVVTGSTEQLLGQIRSNTIDVGILTLPSSLPDLDAIPLCEEELVVVTSPRHEKFGKRKTVRVNELRNQPLIIFTRDAATRSLLDRFFERAGFKPRIAMESESVATIKPLVQINLGISIMPLRAVAADARRKELHYLCIQDERLVRQIGLVSHKSDYRPRALGKLAELLKQYA